LAARTGRKGICAPRLTLLVVVICSVGLGLIGLHVEERLDPISLEVEGTDSARAEALLGRHFGASQPFAVLIEGPPAAIDRQVPRLVTHLRRESRAAVLSPFDPRSPKALRPAPRKALILLDYRVSLGEAMEESVPRLERTLASHVRPPLRATQSGYASVSRALQRESLDATERAELISLPLLFCVLLLVFRSLIAALIPLLMGTLTVLAGRGVLVLLSDQMEIAVLALIVCTMMGLALGVDYSLLIVSRFREELARLSSETDKARREEPSTRPFDRRLSSLQPTLATDWTRVRRAEPGKDAGGERRGAHTPVRDPIRTTEDTARRRVRREVAAEAALRTRDSAGRTVVFAGATLFLSILTSAFLQPGGLFVALATALIAVTAISVLLAWLALPALLAEIGSWIDRLGLPARRPQARSGIAAFAALALRRPALAVLLVILPLLLLSAPALAFNTGAPGVDELSATNPARLDAERIDHAVGAGWEAPFLLIAATRHGPITDRADLALLARAERQIAATPGITTVIGPAALATDTRRLSRSLPGDGPVGEQLVDLAPGLDRATAALGRLRRGLGSAAAGSGLLAAGAGRAGEGARLLAAGLTEATQGGVRVDAALDRLAAGSSRLARAQREAGSLSLSLALELRSYLPGLRGNALRRGRRLRDEARAAAASDPTLVPLANRTEVLVDVLAALRDEARELRDTSLRLNGGLNRLAGGGRRLEDATSSLDTAAADLRGGLDRLTGAAKRLADGLGDLQGGNENLHHGLARGAAGTRRLELGLDRAAGRAGPLSSAAALISRRSPDLLDSGFLPLSALDGARPRERRNAARAVSLDRGGQAARLLAIPAAAFNTERSRAVGERLADHASSLQERGDLIAGVGGGAAILNDYGAVTRARLPLVIGTMMHLCWP
jgi:putative drug exporter of the RND superfamily